MQLAARRRQVAPPVFSDASDIGHRPPMSGNVGAIWRSRAASCTSSFSDASDIGYRAPMSRNVGATCHPLLASCTSRVADASDIGYQRPPPPNRPSPDRAAFNNRRYFITEGPDYVKALLGLAIG